MQEMPRAAPKHGKLFSEAPPSQRMTTLEALETLPPPEETAQSMVVRAGREEEEGEGKGRGRRSSISKFIGRVSRKGSRIFTRKETGKGMM